MPTARLFFRKWWLVAVLALGLVTGALVALTPLAIGYGLKSWLLEKGASKVVIEDVDFNPFTGGFGLRGLQVNGGSQVPLEFQSLEGSILWMPMWKSQAHIETLILKGARISVEQGNADAVRVGPLVIPQRADSEPAEEPGWGFGIDRLRISDSQFSYRSTQLQTTVSLQRLELSDLSSWNPEEATRLSLQGAVDQSALGVDGRFWPFAAAPRFSGSIRLDNLRLETFSEYLRQQVHTLRGGVSADISLEAALDQKGAIRFAQQGRLSMAELQIKAGDGDLFLGTIAWDGGAQVKIEPATSRLSAESSGRLKLQDTRLNPGAGATSVRVGLLELASEQMQVQQDGRSGSTTLSHRGSLGIEQLIGQFDDDRLSQESLNWQGDLTLASAAQSLNLSTEGILSSNGLELSLPGTDLDLNQAGLHWSGKASYGLDDGQTRLQTSGDLKLGRLLLDAPQHQQELLAFDGLTLKDIHIQNPQLLDVKGVTFENLLFARHQATEGTDRDAPPAAVRSKRSHLSDVLYSGTEGFYVKRVEHEDLDFTIRRGPKGDFYVVGVIDILLDALAEDTSADTPGTDRSTPNPPAATAAETQAIRVRADEISVLGKSSLTFADYAVNPPYNARLNFNRLHLAKLDTGRPDQRSPFELNARIGKYAQLNVQGSALFFAERLSADITGRLEALELPPLSPYAAAALGYTLTSGQLDADIDIRIKEGKLSGKNRLHIRELEVARLDPEELEKLQPKTTLPLETGLMVLRDDEDSIVLELPIGGDLNNPEFDPTDAINQAVANGMKQGAKTYLGAALFPFGTLITVAEVAGKAAMEIRLDPVVFGAASTTLDTTAREYLQKVAQVLKKRPQMDMKICGLAVEADREAFTRLTAARAQAEVQAKRTGSGNKTGGKGEQAAQTAPASDQNLKDLAEERAAAVKDHIIGNGGIKANRLIACRAKIEKQKSGGKPRTELLL